MYQIMTLGGGRGARELRGFVGLIQYQDRPTMSPMELVKRHTLQVREFAPYAEPAGVAASVQRQGFVS